MVLKALVGYLEHLAGRVPQGMPFLPGQVPLAHLDTKGLWDQKAFVEFLEALGHLVSFIYISVNESKTFKHSTWTGQLG